MRLVIADTSPLNYLVLIEQVEILPALFEKVFVPQLCGTNCDTMRLRRASAAGSPIRLLGWKSCWRGMITMTPIYGVLTTANELRSCLRSKSGVISC